MNIIDRKSGSKGATKQCYTNPQGLSLIKKEKYSKKRKKSEKGKKDRTKRYYVQEERIYKNAEHPLHSGPT